MPLWPCACPSLCALITLAFLWSAIQVYWNFSHSLVFSTACLISSFLAIHYFLFRSRKIVILSTPWPNAWGADWVKALMTSLAICCLQPYPKQPRPVLMWPVTLVSSLATVESVIANYFKVTRLQSKFDCEMFRNWDEIRCLSYLHVVSVWFWDAGEDDILTFN